MGPGTQEAAHGRRAPEASPGEREARRVESRLRAPAPRSLSAVRDPGPGGRGAPDPVVWKRD